MAERKLAVEAGQQIEPKDRDGVNHRQRKLENEKILHHERQRHRDDDAAAVRTRRRCVGVIGRARRLPVHPWRVAASLQLDPVDDGPAEQAARLEREHRDDERERDRQFKLAADIRNERAGEVFDDADGEAADDGAERTS